jgi:anti-sigma B factor antagonist
MTQARFVVTKATGGRSPAVAVSGDIDLANVADFEEAMTKALNGSGELTVDLTKVSYCDSAAVRALFSTAATTQLTMIVRPTGHITTLLGISGLDRVATVIRKD